MNTPHSSAAAKEKMIPCEICGSRQFTVYLEASQKYSMGLPRDPSDRYSAASFDQTHGQIVSCKNCGLIFINPRPPANFIIDAYRNAVDPEYLSEEKARGATAQRFLKLVHKFKRHGRILDVGCAAGFFLKNAREAGWEPFGVEPSRWLAGISRSRFRLDIKDRTLQESRFPDGFFDAVTFWDSLEHTPDPYNELCEAYRVMKEGGHLFISYPNIDCLLVHIFGQRHWWFTPGHLFYFNRQSLSRIARNAGFEPVYSGVHFPRYSVEYLSLRLKHFSPAIHKSLHSICRSLKINNMIIPCYASQALLVAIKPCIKETADHESGIVMSSTAGR